MKIEKIGMRTIKTGIAVAVSVIVAKILRLEYPFFVAMTAIVSMDKTAFYSLKMGKNRVLGTMIGAAVGVLCACLLRSDPLLPGNPFVFGELMADHPYLYALLVALLCGLGIIVMIMICNRLKAQGSIVIGGIVFMAIMVHTDQSPFFYGFHRTIDSLIGASIAVLVNLVVFPYFNIEKLQELMKIGMQKCSERIEAHGRGEWLLPEGLKKLQDIADGIRTELIMYQNDFISKKKRRMVDALARDFAMLEVVIFHLRAFEHIESGADPAVLKYHLQCLQYYYKQLQEESEKENIPASTVQ